MSAETTRIRSWRFHRAPSSLKALFPVGQVTDWLAVIPESLVGLSAAAFLRWRPLHPVVSVRLQDGSTAYWGAVSQSVYSIESERSTSEAQEVTERRRTPRVRLTCDALFDSGSAKKKTDSCHLLNMSSTGVCFTTERALRKGARVNLRVRWPIRLENRHPLEMLITGKIVRAEQTQAALEYDRMVFDVVQL